MNHNRWRAVDDMSALFEDGRDRSWMDFAACAGHPDPDLWSPDTSNLYHKETRIAATICSTCPVRGECLNFGRNERFGIYGGVLMPAGRPIPVLTDPVGAQIKEPAPRQRPPVRQPVVRATAKPLFPAAPEQGPAVHVAPAAELPTPEPEIVIPETVAVDPEPTPLFQERPAPLEQEHAEPHGTRIPGAGVLRRITRWFK